MNVGEKVVVGGMAKVGVLVAVPVDVAEGVIVKVKVGGGGGKVHV